MNTSEGKAMERCFNGEALRQAVITSPYSFTEFAEAIGVSRTHLYNMFGGEAPGCLIMDRILQVLSSHEFTDFFSNLCTPEGTDVSGDV
jgi:hypothetical protein